MAGVKGSGGVGGIGNDRVQGMCHLMTQYRELVHLHFGLIFAVDGTMGNHTRSGDHVSGHAITNKQDHVFRFPNFR